MQSLPQRPPAILATRLQFRLAAARRAGRFCLLASLCTVLTHAQSPATQPTSPESVTLENQPFDPAEKLFGDPLKLRSKLADKGVSIDPLLILDYTKVLKGGLSTHRDSFRQRFDVPITFDTKPLVGLDGGTIYVDYQQEHGPQADRNLVGDAQLVTNSTQSDPRSQLGQLWYQQKFTGVPLRLKFGKMDANADFDVMENSQEFLNNSFSTTPTLYLLPSYPDNATGAALFYEPEHGPYAGVGLFDGSFARGRPIGKFGPTYFLDRDDNLFLIAEFGQRFKWGDRPGKLAAGAWWSTDPFTRLDGSGRQSGTGGVYAVLDQVLWQPRGAASVPSNSPQASDTAAPEQQETPGGVAATFTLSWCDPAVNPIDANAVAAAEWTGPIPHRPIDVLGLGVTWAHFAGDYNTRNPYELTFETFYRVRFTRYLSLKPDLQYVIHPTGSGSPGQPIIRDALVLGVRMELTP